VAAGAKLADFSGWSMPIEYAGGGVLAEHTAVRTAVGLFDVSHLGTGTVTGAGAADLVNRSLSNDLGRIGPGQAQYTLCCVPDGEADAGGVVDDLIVYLHGDDDVLLVPNAANAADVLGRLAAAAPDGTRRSPCWPCRVRGHPTCSRRSA
jgi:aminomethyltransferase